DITVDNRISKIFLTSDPIKRLLSSSKGLGARLRMTVAVVPL
ncbi:9836_t:CDS:1, partial [Acaulospora colombiana]